MKCYIVLNYIIIHLKTAIKGLSTITIVLCLEKKLFVPFLFMNTYPEVILNVTQKMLET